LSPFGISHDRECDTPVEGEKQMTDANSIISIKGITKRFGGDVTAVDQVDLEIRQGEFFALLGPSGCGKTTLLRMIAGFEVPSEGQILIDGQDMATVPPNRRPVNMVFQSYAVFPHMTVFENVGYGLKIEGVGASEKADRVSEALKLVKLDGYGSRMPDQLSGGQRQRVALARALIKRPKVLLLDEPLSALDAKLREAMQLELVHLQETVGITFVIVTHDQQEALSMANRIAVMEDGAVRQLAPPSELYENPNCRFVADFIGKMNLFEGSVSGLDGDEVLIDVPGLGSVRASARAAGGGAIRGEVGLAIRPEKLRLQAEKPAEGQISFEGRVSEVAYYGDVSFVYLVDEMGRSISANLQNASRAGHAAVKVGDKLWCSWDPADSIILTS
jgi:spermidine/putrescine ABC transporter ATP-binding subunit